MAVALFAGGHLTVVREVCGPPTDQLVAPVTEGILISDSELYVESRVTH